MGLQYKNEAISQLTKLMSTEQQTFTTYQIRRFKINHRAVNEYIRMYKNKTQTAWDDWVKYNS